MPDDCIFCKIIAGELPSQTVYEDADTVAFMDIAPATRGHLLVVPRTHARDVTEVSADDFAAVARTAKLMAERVRARLEPAGINLHNACGAVAGQTVFHLHVHVIPRYEGDAVRLPWIPQPGDMDQIAAVAEQLR